MPNGEWDLANCHGISRANPRQVDIDFEIHAFCGALSERSPNETKSHFHDIIVYNETSRYRLHLNSVWNYTKTAALKRTAGHTKNLSYLLNHTQPN